MSFNALEYLFAFLPVAFLGYWLLGIGGWRSPQIAWLVLASLAYYGLVFWFNSGATGLPDWEGMAIWLAWPVGAVVVNDAMGRILRRHPAGWLLALAIAVNVGLLWAYKFSLHPLYYAFAVVVAFGNGLTWTWLATGPERGWFKRTALGLLRLAGMVTFNLALWGWLFIAAWCWAWLAGRPVSEVDPFGITGRLAHHIAQGGPTWQQQAVAASLVLYPIIQMICWVRRRVKWPAIFGGLLGSHAIAMVTAFACIASLFGVPGLGPVPLRVLDYSVTFGIPVSPTLTDILLPLGLSFMILQHIGFLVDCKMGRVRGYTPLKFGMFTLFFVQLPLGPILKWRELEPQLRPDVQQPDTIGNLRIGIGLIILGLFKKVVIADNLGQVVDPLFQEAADGGGLTVIEAWTAGVGFLLQLYFDLSGYADMAIGGARLFGIRIPANFNAPLRAPSIMDFWRRWHITLTRWFFGHIQQPLARWRPGHDWKAITLAIAMLLMGLWHDLAWTFLLWGGIHGVLVVINHSWVRLRAAIGSRGEIKLFLWRWPMVLLTFGLVAISFVPFRADDLDSALAIMAAMLGQGAMVLPAWAWSGLTHVIEPAGLHQLGWRPGAIGSVDLAGGLLLLAALFVVWFLPSSSDLLRVANRLVGADADPAPLAPPPSRRRQAHVDTDKDAAAGGIDPDDIDPDGPDRKAA